jgi:predicted transcriptional regulator
LAVQSGADRNPGEVLEDWMLEQREAISAHIETGFAQAERGELIDGDAAIEMLRLHSEPEI